MADGATDPGAGGTPGSQDGGGAPQPINITPEMLGEYKDDPIFQPYNGKPVGEFFKTFANAQKMIGGEKVVLPQGKLDTPENWAILWERLGKPKDVNGYEIKPVEGAPAVDENMMKGFKEACHKLNILPKQAQALYEWFDGMGRTVAANQEAEQQRIATETEEALMKDLKTKDKYDSFIKGASEILMQYGGEKKDIDLFIEKFGNDLTVMRVLGNVAQRMSEEALIRGDKRFGLNTGDPKAVLNGILYDKENVLNKAYYDKNHPQHQHAVDEVYRLQEAIHGRKVVSNT